MVERANVRIDEFADKNNEESEKEPKDYQRFVYVQGVPDTSPEQKTESQPRFTELQQRTTEQQPKVPEPQQEHTEQNVVPQPSDESHGEPRTEPILAKYVRRHLSQNHIIGDKSVEVMTRSKLKDNTCLISDFEPRTVQDALENEDWINAMNAEIEQIEKNNTWTLVPRSKDKNMIGTKWIFRNKLNENGELYRTTLD